MKNKIEIINRFAVDDKIRANKMKLVAIENFVQIYVDSGTERITGFRKRANIRLNAAQLKKLKEWLNSLELKA